MEERRGPHSSDLTTLSVLHCGEESRVMCDTERARIGPNSTDEPADAKKKLEPKPRKRIASDTRCDDGQSLADAVPVL